MLETFGKVALRSRAKNYHTVVLASKYTQHVKSRTPDSPHQEDEDQQVGKKVSDANEDVAQIDSDRSRPRLIRSSTFVLDENARSSSNRDDKNDMFSSTLHAGGIRAILQRANKRFVFPAEIKSYISSHFQMIKEENEFLRHSLEHKSKQLDSIALEHQDCKSQRKELENLKQKLKQVDAQLERERLKTKAMIRQLKEASSGEGHSGVESVVWFGLPSSRGRNVQEDLTIIASRPSSSLLDLDESVDGRGGGKAYKGRVRSLKKEIKLLREVLQRELGSPSAVEAAMKGSNSSWQGRDEQIRRLEDALARSSSNDQRPSSGDSTGSEATRREACRLRRQLAEVERDRLSEYVQVVSTRLSRAEEVASRTEGTLREERRKAARLEHLLEKAHVGGGGPTGLSASMRIANASDDVKALTQELKAARAELEVSKMVREEDWQVFLRMAAESRRLITEGVRNINSKEEKQ